MHPNPDKPEPGRNKRGVDNLNLRTSLKSQNANVKFQINFKFQCSISILSGIWPLTTDYWVLFDIYQLRFGILTFPIFHLNILPFLA